MIRLAPRLIELRGKTKRLLLRHDELTIVLDDQPIAPNSTTLAEITNHVTTIINTGSANQRKALVDALIASDRLIPRVSPAPRPASERALAQRFADAFAIDDVDGVIAADRRRVAAKCRPPRTNTKARRRSGRSWPPAQGTAPGGAITWCPTRANNQPAFALYLTHGHAPTAHAAGLIVAGDRIAAITRFLDTSLPHHFGLADVLGDQ